MNLLKSTIGIILIAFSFSSCDNIAYKDAKENPQPIVIPVVDTTKGDSTQNLTYKPVTNFEQRVFLEDYTGHTCGNCPFAAAEATRLHGVYKEKIVIMAIHCGQFAKPNINPSITSFKADFRTPIGDALDSKFGASNAGLPRGVVGRKKFATTKVSLLSYTEWGNKANQILSTPGFGVGLEINPKYNSGTRSVILYVNSAFNKAYSGEIKMSAYIVEDKIFNWQKFYPSPGVTKEIENFEHNHMLRVGLAPVNGSYSLSSTNSFAAGQSVKTEWQATLPVAVVADNAKIIFVLSNALTEEVIQVSEEDLKSN